MKVRNLFLSACLIVCSACTNFKQIGSSVLSSTGYVSGQQAEGIFDAGEKLAKSQESLTPEQEYYLGRAVSAKILAKYQPVMKPDLVAYVNKVGKVLANASDVPETFNGYHFVVVESPNINALAAPSGYVYVTSAFVRKLPSEDALAAVLAHEIGHVVMRHGVNAISNANLFAALGGFAQQGASIAASQAGSPVDLNTMTDLFGESVSGVLDKLLTSGYDRKQEYAADEYAVKLLARAGYNPNAMVEVLQMLNSQKGGDDSGWYATHPSPSDRLDEVKEAMEDNSIPGGTDNKIRSARFSQATSKL